MEQSDENGTNFIPASQRPDGTWRKPRRVKEGYVPQEEVPLYESKGKQFLSRKTQIPAGLSPCVTPHRSIPGLFIEEKPKKDDKPKREKKKPKNVASIENTTKALSKAKIIETPAQDPAKRLKNLKKRLREIEALQLKIQRGELKGAEREQLDKIDRKKEVLREIKELEIRLK